MPRTTKKDKFFYQAPKKNGAEILLGVNDLYEGDTKTLTLKDLEEFLKEKNIDSSKVSLPSSFKTTAIV
jgi:hypothetical protein